MKKVVKIYPREYWASDNNGVNVIVNGEPFSCALDEDIETSEMAQFFGEVVEIEFEDGSDYFIIQNDEAGYLWNSTAIQEECTKDDYPEYFL